MASGENSKKYKLQFTKELSEKQMNLVFEDTDKIFEFVQNQLQIKCMQIYQMVTQLQAIPLAWNITSICGNVLSHTFSKGRSIRNEFLLLHAFYKTEKYSAFGIGW